MSEINSSLFLESKYFYVLVNFYTELSVEFHDYFIINVTSSVNAGGILLFHRKERISDKRIYI